MFKNFFWSAARNWGIRLGAVVVFFVLARILSVDQLGTFSAILAIMALAELFAENGLGDAVVQAGKISPAILSATMIVNGAVALVLSVALLSGAGLLERAFDAPHLAPYLAVAVLSLLLNSLSYVPQGLLRREFAYQWLAVRALVATFVSGVIAIGMAFAGFGVWSMVAQAVSFAATNCLLVWWKRPFNPFARPDFGGALPLVRFGLFLLGSRTLYYLSTRAIELMIAFRFGPGKLALYVIGTRVYFVASQLLTAVLLDVAYATIANLRTKGESLTPTITRILQIATMAAVPIFLGLAAVAPELCHVAFGDKGIAAAPFLSIVGVYGAIQILVFLGTTTLSACGKPKYETGILSLQAMLSACVIFPPWGMSETMMVGVNCMVALIIMPLTTVLAMRVAQVRLRDYVRTALPAYVAGAVMLAVIFGVRHVPVVAGIGSPFVRGAILVAAGAASYAGALALLAPRAVRQGVAAIGKKLRRPPRDAIARVDEAFDSESDTPMVPSAR